MIMSKVLDLVGKTFGRLTVLERAGNDPRGKSRWLCQCSCNETKVVDGSDLKTGNAGSCGCVRREKLREQAKAKATHGHTRGGRHTPTYRSWQSMLNRCFKQNRPGYANYGARGITVCDSWLISFENFLADMGEAPPGLTLDRFPDNNGNYVPANCRWATPTQQSRHRRSNKLLSFDGQTRCLADWADRFGLRWTTLRNRLAAGWPAEKALTAPIQQPGRNQQRNRWLTHQGETMIVTDWAAARGMPAKVLRKRLAAGWSVSRALTTPVRAKRKAS
jgi:hypothetical protein